VWFKGSFSQYVSYLNSIDISQLFSSWSLSNINTVSSWDVSWPSGPKNTIAEELEWEFLPEPSTFDESDFWFSWRTEDPLPTWKSQPWTTQNTASVSAQDLVDLVISKEE
jgi:hypothetical protein